MSGQMIDIIYNNRNLLPKVTFSLNITVLQRHLVTHVDAYQNPTFKAFPITISSH